MTGFVLYFFMYGIRAGRSNMLPSRSQYGTSNGCNDRQQWSKGKRLKACSSLDKLFGPDLLPPYKVVHSVYVKYL